MTELLPTSANSPLGPTPTSTNAQQDANSLAADFDTFLTLLTTQLQNQLPTDPLDTNEFTNQLVQYSTVEQQIKSNENLEDILATLGATNVASLASYIGNDVVAAGDTTQLSNGQAQWTYEASDFAQEAVVRVRDASGNTVFTEVTSFDRGEGTYSWDGRDDSGTPLPDGLYSISINAATNGTPVNVSTNAVEGTVSAVDTSGSEPTLTVNGQTVPLSAITQIRAPGTTI